MLVSYDDHWVSLLAGKYHRYHDIVVATYVLFITAIYDRQDYNLWQKGQFLPDNLTLEGQWKALRGVRLLV